MVCVYICSTCIHNKHELIDGWLASCEAWPEGFPIEFEFGKIKPGDICNNGIGYEPDGTPFVKDFVKEESDG